MQNLTTILKKPGVRKKPYLVSPFISCPYDSPQLVIVASEKINPKALCVSSLLLHSYAMHMQGWKGITAKNT
jgi:hypothetical protein